MRELNQAVREELGDVSDDTIVQEIHLPASGVMGSCLLCIATE
jgi:hypothetical protein